MEQVNNSAKYSNDTILSLCAEFNQLIRPAVDGPNCIDRKICDGNCCFIHIDVPKSLAEEFIRTNMAKKDDFQRGDIFTFEINVDLKKLRCVFYDRKINGCSLHFTGIKPPQCWVYPTGLDPESAKDVCKKAGGWKIINPGAVKKAKIILDQYVELAKQEGIHENSPEKIHERFQNPAFDLSFTNIKPSAIAGIQDTWETFLVLIGEGFNLGMRSICSAQNCDKNYFECELICGPAKESFKKICMDKIPHFIAKEGFRKEYVLVEFRQVS